ncbi:MAG: RNA 2',3'-cyclic phosphodiesterase [FCB group bacterium]|nr:RNA 2',3'-cyclic phosphodiesterase [FCB group bacterium]
MIRLFIALPLNKEIENKLGDMISQLKQNGGDIKWVKPQNIHLTVKFLGDTEQKLVDDIIEHINSVIIQYQPIITNITHWGAFPNLRRPRVIWVGIEKNTETIIQLAEEIDTHISQLGWEKENKKFKAHFTLGRVRNNRGLERLTEYIQEYKFEEVNFVFDRIILFKSTLTPQGPIYEKLHEAKLGEKYFT